MLREFAKDTLSAIRVLIADLPEMLCLTAFLALIMLLCPQPAGAAVLSQTGVDANMEVWFAVGCVLIGAAFGSVVTAMFFSLQGKIIVPHDDYVDGPFNYRDMQQ